MFALMMFDVLMLFDVSMLFDVAMLRCCDLYLENRRSARRTGRHGVVRGEDCF